MAEWVIEPLDPTHDRAAFTCGRAPLDDFLRSLAGQYERRRLGKTYVTHLVDEKRVEGYYTLASGAVSFANLPIQLKKKLPRHSVPVVLLARLAVSTTVQGGGLGRHLLVNALERSLDLSTRVGIHAVEVEAIDDDARLFYEKYGFVSLADDRAHLYLPLATIQKSFGPRGG